MSRNKSTEGFQALTVVQEGSERLSNKVLATEIRTIAQGVKQLLAGGINEDAVVVLVTNAIPKSYGISEKTVRTVLFQGLAKLEEKYLRGNA